MGLSETQTLLARLYVDGDLRRRFFDDPAAVAAEFGFTSDEAAGLFSLSESQTEFFARSLKFKRLGEVRRLLPHTAEILGRRLTELFLIYAEAGIPGGLLKHQDDALSFASFAEHADPPLAPEWAGAVLRYEAAWLEARRLKTGLLVRLFRYDLRPILRGSKPRSTAPARRLTLGLWWRLPWGRLAHRLSGIPGW